MPGYCPAPLTPSAVRLWKTFRSKLNAIPVNDKNCSASHRNRCSPSDRNAVRNHNGMAFSFRPESRSPSTGFPMIAKITRSEVPYEHRTWVEWQ
jgi:hypothetical protein